MAGAAMAAPAISNAYTVPDLPYAYDALEPYVDAPTMKFHHDKHHATYVANINNYMDGKDEPPILDLMADALEAGPVRNSGGGHYNHAFFWEEMTSPDKAKKSKVSDQLAKLIDSSFGSMDEMKAKFEAQAAPGAVFGSGWVWVVVNNAGDKLEIVGMSRI
jgi:Fe-Mn family superoxide dismutase